MIKFSMHGANGKMGRQIMQAALQDGSFQLVGACDQQVIDDVDVGFLCASKPIGLKISSDLQTCLKKAQVMIDFSNHEATIPAMKLAAQAGVPVVIGTTGFNHDEEKEIASLAKDIACVKAPNMSIGINLLFKLVREAAGALGDDYDIEIVEAHHRWKKDAPSGTAVKFYEILADAIGANVKENIVTGREGRDLKRQTKEIGVAALRGGDIVGDHTITFAGLGERIEFIHRAHSRDTFARGALRAAKFVVNQSPGLYDMLDVLGLKK